MNHHLLSNSTTPAPLNPLLPSVDFVILFFMRNIISRNPFSGQIKEQIAFANAEGLSKQLLRAADGFDIHRKRGAREKCSMIQEIKPLIERRKVEIAKLITFQTGKPITEAENEVAEAIKVCEYYGKHYQFVMAQNVKTDAKKKTLIKYMPTGTIYHVLPFSYPFLLNFVAVIPQILLGNCSLVRNSDSTPGVGKIVDQLLSKAGFESGEYQNVFNSSNETQSIISDDRITGVNFIGSSKSGAKIAALSGKYIKKSSMSLSSSDALIVMEDANLHQAVQGILKLKQFNGGQGGPSPKRIIVKKQVYNTFKDMLIDRLKNIKYGNPQYKETEIGPLARLDLYEKLQQQIHNLPKGFKIIYQRERIEKPFFPLTLIEGTSERFDEEFIGPIFQIFQAQTDNEAVALANNTKFGNTAYIFTAAKGEQLTNQINSGQTYLNSTGKFNPLLPFGGTNQSGYGKLGWYQGVRHFANIKTNYIN